jgi:hypothetical protein
MTVSRLERLAWTNFFPGLRARFSEHGPSEPQVSTAKLWVHVSLTWTFGSCFSTSNLGEIRDLIGRRADAGEQRETIGAHRLVLIIHENAFKE